MFIDPILRPRDASQGTYDVQVYPVAFKPRLVRVYPRDASFGTYDVQVRPANLLVEYVEEGDPGFPTQFSGLRVFYGGVVNELCLVAVADAPTGMGGQMFIDKNGTTYAVYLVETSDPDASSVRIRTSAGTKSIRVKT